MIFDGTWDDPSNHCIRGIQYAGDHEVIENLIQLTEVYFSFERWSRLFRSADKGRVFSEAMSRKLARGEVRLK